MQRECRTGVERGRGRWGGHVTAEEDTDREFGNKPFGLDDHGVLAGLDCRQEPNPMLDVALSRRAEGPLGLGYSDGRLFAIDSDLASECYGSMTSKPWMCRNSEALKVATAQRRCMAVAATIRSCGPIICPAPESCAHRRAWVRATPASKDTTSRRRKVLSNHRRRRRRRAELVSTSMPNHNSESVMALAAAGSGGRPRSQDDKSKWSRSSAMRSELSRISPTGS